MSRNVAHHNSRRRRSAGIVAGLGAGLGGALLATISQLTLAPGAHAQPDDIFANVQDTISLGQSDFSLGADDFNLGLYADGLAWDLGGSNDVLILPGQEFLLDGFGALTGDNSYSGLFVPAILPPPADLNAAFADAAEYVTQAQTYFTTATSDFAADHVLSGLDSLTAAADYSTLLPTDAIILGLADSVLGGLGFN